MRFLIVLLAPLTLLLFHPVASAKPCGCAVSQVRDFRDLIHKTAVFDKDDRRTESQFAAENNTPLAVVQKRFAASGSINCANGASFGSAQLTIKNNLITTAAHILKDNKTCEVFAKATDCVFTVRSRGTQRQIKIERQVESGFENKPCPQLVANDFMILKLSEPVEDVEPYQVDPNAVRDLKPEQSVVSVAHSIDVYNAKIVNGNKVYEFPQHFANCKIKNVYGSPPYKFKSNCDGSGFTSGGGILSGNADHPVLLGIARASSETDAQADEQFKKHKSISGKYDENKWYFEHVAVAGLFYEALMRATISP